MSENCPMETVSGKLEIRLVDRPSGIDNYCKTENVIPIIGSDENVEGPCVTIECE